MYLKGKRMKINKEDRGFYWIAKSYYGNSTHDYISFGIYPDGGDQGTIGEMIMKWIKIGKKNSPRLECFDDSFSVLSSFADLIEELAKFDSTDFPPEVFVKILKKCGFKDLTAYVDPDTVIKSELEK